MNINGDYEDIFDDEAIYDTYATSTTVNSGKTAFGSNSAQD